MYKRPRKFYIPVTRSGSSMLASLLTQWINQPKGKIIFRPVNLGNLATVVVLILSAALLIYIYTKGA